MGSGPRKPAVPKVVGKSYAEARRALTNAGWQPTRSDRGSDASGNAELFRSMGFTEMVSCSGTGFAPCRFRFVDRSGRILAVVTQGEEGYDGHATVTRVTITNR